MKNFPQFPSQPPLVDNHLVVAVEDQGHQEPVRIPSLSRVSDDIRHVVTMLSPCVNHSQILNDSQVPSAAATALAMSAVLNCSKKSSGSNVRVIAQHAAIRSGCKAK